MDGSDVTSIVGELDAQEMLDNAGLGPTQVAIGDLFAVGCYFVQVGRKELGHKLCHTALSACYVEESVIHRVLSYIDDHDEELADFLRPHLEVPSMLFEE